MELLNSNPPSGCSYQKKCRGRGQTPR